MAWGCDWGWALAARQGPVLGVAILHRLQHLAATRGSRLLRWAAARRRAGVTEEVLMGSQWEGWTGQFQWEWWVCWRSRDLPVQGTEIMTNARNRNG